MPGSGKTTLAHALLNLAPEALLISEVIRPRVPDPSPEFFVTNDRDKERIVAKTSATLYVLDRYWPSTIAYRAGEAALMGLDGTTLGLVERVFGARLAEPTLYVFLDTKGAVDSSPAGDGFWPSATFRLAVRRAYYELFERVEAPVLVVRSHRRRLPSLALAHAILELVREE